MNPVVGWSLTALAFAAGWIGWGWKGLVLAVTVVVFWMLLQFSRSLRVLRNAGANPMGTVASAVMLHSKLRKGMRLLDILPLARSLGRRVADSPETFEWRDASGAAVRAELVGGRLSGWTLERPDETAVPPPTA